MFCAVGTSVLGYGNYNVNKSVLKNIKKGNLTTLNCPEEVYLAKKVIDHHPWASMAKFTRGGGEANALAIRIARSCTKKKMLLSVVTMDGMIGIYLQTLIQKII